VMRTESMEAVRLAYWFLSSRDARELLRASRDFRRYVPWRAARELFDAGVAEEFASRSLGDFPDPNLALLLAEVLDYAGYGRVSGGYFHWAEGARELVEHEPPISSRIIIEYKPVIDRILDLLPSALSAGRSGAAHLVNVPELRKLFAAFLDSSGYNLAREWLIRFAGLDKLPPEATVVDVGAGVGASTAVLLKLTRCRIVATEPYEENVESLKLYVKALKAENRVRVLQADAGDLPRVLEENGVGEADAVYLVNVLHWSTHPLAVLEGSAQVLKEGGIIALMQGTLDTPTAKIGNLLPYLLGSGLLPTSDELEKLFRRAQLKVLRKTKFPADMFVLTRT